MKRDNLLLFIALAVFSFIILGAGFVLPVTNKATADGEKIIIASNPAADTSTDSNKNTYFRKLLMKDYPVAFWAKRSNNTAGASPLAGHSGYTEMQILPDTRSLIQQCNASMPVQYGNMFNNDSGLYSGDTNPASTIQPASGAGDLSTRFQAGGPGIFLDANQYGGWATTTFGHTGWSVATLKTGDYLTDYPTRLSRYLSPEWNNFRQYFTDSSKRNFGKFDQIGPVGAGYNNYPDTGFTTVTTGGSNGCVYPADYPDVSLRGTPLGGVTPSVLVGGETALFVRKFNLTQAQADAANGADARFEAITDDFSRVWLNGFSLGRASISDGDIPTPVLPTYGKPDGTYSTDDPLINNPQKNLFQVGSNTLAFQVTNKMHWDVKKELASDTVAQKAAKLAATIVAAEEENPISLYYRLYIEPVAPDVPGGNPTLTCPPTPQAGLAPLVVKVTPSIANPKAGVTYTYNYNMGDGQPPANNRGTPFYYTYSVKGTYTITVTTNPPTEVVSNSPCTATVTVTNPSDSSGGEVNPTN